MAPRKSKPTPDEHRKLVKQYNIHFDGGTQPSRWPTQYAHIFQKVLDIKRLGYDDYKPSETRRMAAVAEMKDRIAKLNRIAHTCRDQRENEATWRGLTEPEIVCRFAEEVACGICTKRLWTSEFKALPHDAVEASHLQRNRDKREFCSCSLLEKAMNHVDDSRAAQLFLSRYETQFAHDAADPLVQTGLRPRAPDCVFGLRETKCFNTQDAARHGLRQSPYKDGKVLYPFLIIEAKSEKGSPGFESIENQTAFPIRTLLKLQYDLAMASGRDVRPLVWFLANQGDDWRVYGSIRDGPAWRVIHLWRGSLLSKDETLQLLLIMDYICDWARDIYRRDIVRCLALGDVEMRDVTPAYTTTTLSQRGESVSVPPSPSLATLRATSPEDPSRIDVPWDADGHDNEMQDAFPAAREFYHHRDEDEDEDEDEDDDDSSLISDSNDEDDHSFTWADSSDRQPLLRFSGSQAYQTPWSRRATIRHSNVVLFKFRHFTVPQESEALNTWLQSFDGRGSNFRFSQTLLQHMETGNALTITINGILQLENIWMRTTHQLSSKNDEPILAWIWFHSYVRQGDWQVVRELECLTISQQAIIQLATIAGVPRSLSRHDWDVHRCHCLGTEVQSLRSFCGRDSIISALLGLRLHLEPFTPANTEVHFRWFKRSEDRADAASMAERFWRSIHPEAISQRWKWSYQSSNVLLEDLSPGAVVPRFLTPHLRVHTSFGAKGAVLMREPLLQRGSAIRPIYCLWVFDETDFEDEPSLGEKIIQVVRSGDIYVGGSLGQLQSVEPPESEKSALELWANILRGRAPADAQWPPEAFEAVAGVDGPSGRGRRETRHPFPLEVVQRSEDPP